MHGWWIAMGLTAAVLALPYARHRRRRARRLRIDLVRAQVERSLSAALNAPPHFSRTSGVQLNPQQPDGTTVLDSPDRGQALPRQPVPSGPRRRVVLSASDLSTTLSPGWRLQ